MTAKNDVTESGVAAQAPAIVFNRSDDGHLRYRHEIANIVCNRVFHAISTISMMRFSPMRGWPTSSDADKEQLLQDIYAKLELRVGTALSDGLSDGQLEEFSAELDRDYRCIASWLDVNAPDFLDTPIYQRLADVAKG